MPQEEERIDHLADLLEAEHRKRQARANLRTHDEMMVDFPPLRGHHPEPTDSLGPTSWRISVDATVHMDGVRRSACPVLFGLLGGLLVGAGLTVLAYHVLGGVW